MNKDIGKKPQIVTEAANAQKGLHWSLEILIFIAVFLVSQLIMVLATLPAQSIMLFSNKDYMDAVASNNLSEIMEISMQVASSDTYIIFSLFCDIIMIAVVFLFCRFIQKRKLRTLGFCKKGLLKEYLFGALLGFLFFSAAVLGSVLTGGLKIEGISPDFSLGLFVLFLLGFMVQGMAEEILCRGYFLVSFSRRYPLYAAALANSLLFAALHLLNGGISILAFINLFLFGIFASLYFINRGNIWGIGAFHSIWNLVQGNFYGIRVSGINVQSSLFTTVSCEGKELLSGGAFGLEGSIMVTIVLCLGIVFLYVRNKKKSLSTEAAA